MQGDIRLDPNSSTIFLVRPRPTISSSIITSWTVQPYPRKGIAFVKNWTVKLAAEDDNTVPKCSKTHTHPALLFSMGGYSGNHFHDFADILVPLFSTSFHLKREVQFLASDYKPWWPSKFRGLLDRLTRHELVDINAEREVNCYNEFIAGLKFQSELVIDPLSTHSSSMRRFRQFLREAYSLERTKATKRTKGINDNNQSGLLHSVILLCYFELLKKLVILLLTKTFIWFNFFSKLPLTAHHLGGLCTKTMDNRIVFSNKKKKIQKLFQQFKITKIDFLQLTRNNV